LSSFTSLASSTFIFTPPTSTRPLAKMHWKWLHLRNKSTCATLHTS
jgi:hypothetical protein